MRYKVGDRVRWIGETDEGEVTQIRYGGNLVVRMDDGTIEDEPAQCWEPAGASGECNGQSL